MLLVTAATFGTYGSEPLSLIVWPYGPVWIGAYLLGRAGGWALARHDEKLVSAIAQFEGVRLPIPFTPWQLRSFAYIDRSLPGHRAHEPSSEA